jgi:hypothetical protein
MDSQSTIKDLFLFMYPVVYVVGTLGNMSAFIVFSRKRFENSIFAVYFRILAITDSYTLIYCLNDFSSIKFNKDFQNTSLFVCKTFFYLLFCIGPVSAWILVMVSFDRMLKVKKPTGFRLLKKRSFQFSYCAALLVFNLAYYVPEILFKNPTVFNETEPDSNITILNEYCYYTDPDGIVGWMDLVNSTVIPFTLMIIFSTLTIFYLVRSRSRIATNNQTVLSRRDIKFSVTSIALNICFLVLNSPIVTLNIIWVYINISDAEFEFYNAIASIFFYINFGMLFYINLFFNSIFRDEIMNILKRNEKRNISLMT